MPAQIPTEPLPESPQERLIIFYDGLLMAGLSDAEIDDLMLRAARKLGGYWVTIRHIVDDLGREAIEAVKARREGVTP